MRPAVCDKNVLLKQNSVQKKGSLPATPIIYMSVAVAATRRPLRQIVENCIQHQAQEKRERES
jgi:hypothetical protein